MNRLMLAAILALCCSTVLAESRSDVDALELRALTTSQTVSELQRRLSMLEKLATLEDACQLQLDHHELPLSCYDAIALRTKQHLPSESANYRGLNEKCERIARDTRALTIPPDNHLPKSCLKTVRETVRVNRYKAGMDFENFL